MSVMRKALLAGSTNAWLRERATKAAFICMVPLILVDSAVSVAECTLDVPFSTLTVCEKKADGDSCQRRAAAPRTVRPDSSSPLGRSPLK